ncbi:hypothetical protein ACJ72_07597, partial [Emergomyces africanus]
MKPTALCLSSRSRSLTAKTATTVKFRLKTGSLDECNTRSRSKQQQHLWQRQHQVPASQPMKPSNPLLYQLRNPLPLRAPFFVEWSILTQPLPRSKVFRELI